MERLFDYDPFLGVRTYFSTDEKGDSWKFRYEYDPVTYELEASKELAKTDELWDTGVENSWLHFAHIPNQIMHQWATLGVDITDPAELCRMVERPEWAYLKNTTKKHKAAPRIIIA
jgi:hypothetical protein